MVEVLPNSVDANHQYKFRSGEYGEMYSYWYIDPAGNYFLYSNAPEEHIDHDPVGGEPIMSPDQPFLHNAPQFFTPEGYKRNMAAPEGVTPLPNESYNPASIKTSWYEYYLSDMGDIRYLYLDKDVKENLDLYVQHQTRVVDSGLNRLRKFAAQLFQKDSNERDKAIGCILQLVDQAWYRVEDLVQARVADIDFIDDTVYLLGRKIKVDVNLYNYLTSLAIGRDLEAPLFSQNTLHGSEMSFGLRTICSTFAYLRVSPVFLPYWHASHLFSKIMSKLHFMGVRPEDVESQAYTELANVLNTSNDVKYLVDFQVSETLLRNYSSSQPYVKKAFNIAASDSFGVAQVFSDLIERRGDELEFSQWLHSQPLHSSYEGDITADEQELLEEAQKQKNLSQSQENVADAGMTNDEDANGEPDNVINEQGQTEEDVLMQDA